MDVKGSILAEGGVIVEAGANLSKPKDAEAVDCDGLCLCPGLIDMRAELGEPGEEHKETFETAADAALSSGVTSVVCLPNTKPVIDDMAVIEFIRRRSADAGRVRIYPYAAATKGQEGQSLSEYGLLKQAGALAFTDLPKSIASAQLMRRAMSYAKNYGAFLMAHPEDASLSSNALMHSGELSTRLGLAGASAVSEVIQIERDLRLAEDVDARIHIAHVSTALGVDAVRAAKARGVKVTCDTSPPYFALNENEVGLYRTFAKLSPPLRSEDDRKAVVAGLQDGTIDAIASDHSPQDVDSKRLPFAQAAFGGLGLETLLPISLELYHKGELPLLSLLRLLTQNPAQILGLPQGRLAKGAPADFAIFDLNRAHRIETETMRSKSKNTPFDKRPVMGRAVMTVLGGKVVYRAEKTSGKKAA